MGDHYAAIAKATGKELERPTLPAALVYLWNHFIQLHRGRSYNGFGANPISWNDFHAYCQLTRTALTPWEVETIRMLDEVYLEETSKSE
jgi:hypothetical protein